MCHLCTRESLTLNTRFKLLNLLLQLYDKWFNLKIRLFRIWVVVVTVLSLQSPICASRAEATNSIVSQSEPTATRNLIDLLADATRQVDANPGNSIALYDRALAYSNLGRIKEALADAKSAIQVDGSLSEAHCLLAHLLEESGDLAGAEIAASRAVSIDSSRIDFRLRRADILILLKNDDAAALDLQYVLSHDIDNVIALQNLAAIRLRQHRDGEAQVLLQKYLRYSKDVTNDGSVSLAVASLLVASNKYTDALSYLDSHPSESNSARRLRARALFGSGEHLDALKEIEKLTDPESAKLTGELFFLNHECSRSADAFSVAAPAYSQDLLFWRNFSAASLCEKNFVRAAFTSGRAIKIDPLDATSYQYRADALRGTGDLAGAVAAGRQALKLGGINARLLMMVGIDEYKLGDKSGGYSDYKAGCQSLTSKDAADLRMCAAQLPRMSRQ